MTGGAGYIGSHTCIALIEAGYTVIIADNLCNSSPLTIEKIVKITGKRVKFYEIDVTDADSVNRMFSEIRIDGVIHLAGLKAVGESVKKPLLYYKNNLISTMVLANACITYGVVIANPE